MLDDIQRGLETLYRVETELDVRDFLLDAAARDSFAPTRSPREQLLIAESDGGLELGLFLDAAVLDNLAARDPRRGLDDGNLSDFLLMVEGARRIPIRGSISKIRRHLSEDHPKAELSLRGRQRLVKRGKCRNAFLCC